MTPKAEQDLFLMLGRIDQRTEDIHKYGCQKMQEHLAAMNRRDPDSTNSNGSGSSVEGRFMGGLFQFKGKGLAARVISVGVAISLAVLCAGYVRAQLKSLVPEIKQGIIHELRQANVTVKMAEDGK